jgi:hypothetical protein
MNGRQPLDECLEWQGSKNKDGYGTRRIAQRTYLAHRIAYSEAFGDPGALNVLHRCDNPACVRPSHLFLGTQRDNIYDCMAKGRRADQSGAKGPAAKLTEADVAEIRRLYVAGGVSQESLGRRFGVTQAAISAVVRGRTWATAAA